MKKTAVITGVGPGLGASLVRKFASEGYQVGLLARSLGYIQTLATELEASGTKALRYQPTSPILKWLKRASTQSARNWEGWTSSSITPVTQRGVSLRI